MKIERILDNLNSFEKNSFLKIIDNLIADKPSKIREIDKILNDSSGDLKSMDNINIGRVFKLLSTEFESYLEQELMNSTGQVTIVSDILVRDGNCIMKQDWLSRLYDAELKNLKKKVKDFNNQIDSEKSKLDLERQKLYRVYKACLSTAFKNNDLNNQERKISFNEQTILNTLSAELEMSNEETKLIRYSIVPLESPPVDAVITELKNLGLIFFSKKNNVVYIADEIVAILRKLKGKQIADKYFRRVLKNLREPQINLVCRKHGIDWKKPIETKIFELINEGISFRALLRNDIYKPGTKLTEIKKEITDLATIKLQMASLRGATVDEKIDSLILHFEELEKDDKVGISIDGYEKLLLDLDQSIQKAKNLIKSEFELQEEQIMNSFFLLDYNIKPADVLEVIPEKELEQFCTKSGIKTRGNLISNILDKYRDSDNLYLENYHHIGNRDLKALKENGIQIKESQLGVKFEDLTKKVLTGLGFTVNEKLRRKLNTAKDKIDIVISLSEDELIIIECKSVKEKGYNKFSSVSRQIKAYINLAEKNGFKVTKSILVAPDFSDDFVRDCGYDFELNLSLVKADSLKLILDAFKQTKLKTFPHNLLMRDVLIQEDRIIKAIGK
tara:strand:+ start:137 stop:1984 length:1848 start_codon:yes stop_codon:yes gene_type:complete